jgi:hypothetical protein
MLRRFLTYHLILAVAVGHLLCCCTAERLLAGSPAKNTPAPVSGAAGAPPKVSHSCCANRQASKPAPAKHKSPEQKPSPHKPGEKCPCKDSASQVKAPAQLEGTELSSLLRLATAFDLGLFVLAPFVSTLACDFGTEGDRSRGHVAAGLSTDDLLFAHHNLRC